MLRSITRINITKALIQSSQRNISTTSRFNEIFKVQSEKDFEDRVLKSKKVIIVDFMATWCNPCKMLTPRIEKIADENKDKVDLAKVKLKHLTMIHRVVTSFIYMHLLYYYSISRQVDIDELTDLSLEYGIQAVPVLGIMKNGKLASTLVGLQDADVIRKWVKSNIE